jgi:alginate O-acetyltransferase complex protein AlgJ
MAVDRVPRDAAAGDPARSVKRSRLDGVLVGLFLVAIAAPTIDQMLRSDKARGPARELRLPAPRPGTPNDWKSFRAYPTQYEAFHRDTFGLRDVLLRWNSFAKFCLLGDTPSPLLVPGKDGWIFYRGDFSIEVYRGLMPFDAARLSRWKRELELRAHALARRHCHYLFVLCPNKETIYPERMPDSINRVGPTRMEELVPYLREHSDVDVLDLRPAFLAAKAQDHDGDYLYFPLGTHWSGRGSLLAYREIVRHIRDSLPSAHVLFDDEIEWQAGDGLKDTWADRMYLADVLHQFESEPVRKAGPGFEVVSDEAGPPQVHRMQAHARGMPNALFFHDSFGLYISRFLAASFGRLCMRWSDYDTQVVLSEQPDIVVEMYVERVLVNPPPGPGGAPAEYVLPEVNGVSHVMLDLCDARTADAFVAADSMPLERVQENACTALRFKRQKSGQGLIGPPMRAPDSGRIAARLDIESDSPGSMDVFWKTEDALQFRRTDKVSFDLGRGRSVKEIPLPIPAGACRLLLRPLESEATITVHALQVLWYEPAR